MKWYQIKAAADGRRAEVYIYDYIGMFGVEAKQFIDELNELDDDEIDLRINTPGGNVFEGNAIYNALKRHKAKITSYIDGLAASMGSIIALAGDKVVIADNAMYMIHNPSAGAWGGAEDLRKTADTLDKIKSVMLNIYHAKSGIDVDELATMLDDETWLTAEECIDHGFADETVEGVQAAACFSPEKFKGYKHVPESVIDKRAEGGPDIRLEGQLSGTDIKRIAAELKDALAESPDDEPEPEYNHRTPLYARLAEIQQRA